ncbi:photosystem I protein PsaX [Merismopedia glauca]|nr:photosystem I protein PsaX [Merismopedia glauca]
MATDTKENPQTAQPSNVIPGLIIFLSINFLVAAMYFGILNP